MEIQIQWKGSHINRISLFSGRNFGLEERTIIGTPRDCRRRLAEVREEWGIEHIAFYLHAGARDITRARQSLELFASEVMPEFR